MLTVLYNIRRWFIGDILKDLEDDYEIQRVNLVFVICMAVSLTLLALFTSHITLGYYQLAPFSSSALVITVGTLFILKYTRKTRLPGLIICISGYAILFANYFVPDIEHFSETLFIVDIVLVAFFLLGTRWGLFFMLCCTVMLSVNMWFIYPNSLEVVADMDTADITLGIVVILISSAITYYLVLQFIKTTSIAENKLRSANEALTRQNELKLEMLKETHHRVKNNFQMVNSMLRLQQRKFEDASIVEVFDVVQDRIRAMAVLHESMYKFRDFEKVNIREFLGTIVSSLVDSYSGDKEIKTALNIGPESMNMNTVIPLALILNEMVTNSLKYAFKGRASGNISVDIQSTGEDTFVMVVKDDGVGIQATLKPEGKSTSLGSELIEVFTHQLDGTLEKLEEPGTAYRINFKAQK